MKLSRTVAYAVQATLQLAQAKPNEPVPCSQLACNGGMPERFLLQVLRSLVNHGVLSSTRGVDGGYTLERSPDDISLLDLVEAIEGPVVASLPRTDALTSPAQVKLREALNKVAVATRTELARIKLSHLSPDGPRRPAGKE